MKTRPHASAPRSQRKAFKAAARRRNNWMPGLQLAMRIQKEHRERRRLPIRLHHKAPAAPEPAKAPVATRSLGSGMLSGFRYIVGMFRKRAVAGLPRKAAA